MTCRDPVSIELHSKTSFPHRIGSKFANVVCTALVPFSVLSCPTEQLPASSGITKDEDCGRKSFSEAVRLLVLSGFMSQVRSPTSITLLYSFKIMASWCWPTTHAEMMPAAKDDPSTPEQMKSRVLIEKKTVINLIEAFGVAVKHYLRGEEGVYYVDLYHLVKFLPSYALPPGMPSVVDVSDCTATRSLWNRGESSVRSVPYPGDLEHQSEPPIVPPFSRSAMHHQTGHRPFPATLNPRRVTVQGSSSMPGLRTGRSRTDKPSVHSRKLGVCHRDELEFLLPARIPPMYHLMDFFPLSLFVGLLAKLKKRKELKVSFRL